MHRSLRRRRHTARHPDHDHHHHHHIHHDTDHDNDRDGGPMHDDHRGHRARFAPHGRGGRHRARRGAVVDAVLLLLEERPMHGYELITELEDRSEGRWRPSPGTMYPALNRMVARGLLTADEVDGKKRFTLSDVGRERLDTYRAARADDAPAPWNEHASGGRGDLRRRVSEIDGQARQIGRFGTPEQIEAAGVVLDDTRRKLAALLAERSDDAPADPTAGPDPDTGP